MLIGHDDSYRSTFSGRLCGSTQAYDAEWTVGERLLNRCPLATCIGTAQAVSASKCEEEGPQQPLLDMTDELQRRASSNSKRPDEAQKHTPL